MIVAWYLVLVCNVLAFINIKKAYVYQSSRTFMYIFQSINGKIKLEVTGLKIK